MNNVNSMLKICSLAPHNSWEIWCSVAVPAGAEREGQEEIACWVANTLSPDLTPYGNWKSTLVTNEEIVVREEKDSGPFLVYLQN